MNERIIATPIGEEYVSPATSARQRLYRLSKPIHWVGEFDGDEDGGTEYVLVSAVVATFTGPETYIFPANENGEVTDWGELEGSYRGALNHERAIHNAGWVLR